MSACERMTVPTAVQELLPLERREKVISDLILAYSDILQDGRYDMAFNRLSHHLYNLRSVQFEVERDWKAQEAQEQTATQPGGDTIELGYERV